MKKMFFALVAMVMMTMSANAQSINNSKITFDQLSNYLELTSNQIEPTKTAMAQLENSMQAYYQLQDASKAGETWEKIQARHKATMKNILNDKQYNEYVNMLDLTVKNTTERITQESTAQK
jgi:hypothetical protein